MLLYCVAGSEDRAGWHLDPCTVFWQYVIKSMTIMKKTCAQHKSYKINSDSSTLCLPSVL